VYSWGYNQLGCLGDGTTVSRSAPVRVRLPERALHAAAARSSTCALLQGGHVWCWGVLAQSHLPVLMFGSDVYAGHVPRSLVGGADHFCVVVARVREACAAADSGTCQAAAAAAPEDSAQAVLSHHSADTVW